RSAKRPRTNCVWAIAPSTVVTTTARIKARTTLTIRISHPHDFFRPLSRGMIAQNSIIRDGKQPMAKRARPIGILAGTAIAVSLLAADGTAQAQDAPAYDIVPVAEGLDHPWSLTFMPDDSML